MTLNKVANTPCFMGKLTLIFHTLVKLKRHLNKVTFTVKKFSREKFLRVVRTKKSFIRSQMSILNATNHKCHFHSKIERLILTDC